MSETTTGASPPPKRDAWASRIGLVLAMAGNAVGLGNFLRFPRLAADNGGGAFMIPYLVAFVFLGIPIMWVEWTMGRYGGSLGQSTTPGMFQRMWRSPAAKYLGSLGITLPLLISIFYCYVESWTLSYAVFSAVGVHAKPQAAQVAFAQPVLTKSELKVELQRIVKLPGEVLKQADWLYTAEGFARLDVDANGELTKAELASAGNPLGAAPTNQFLKEYRGIAPEGSGEYFGTIWPALIFWGITILLNVYVLSNGISGGIERLAKVAMPLLFLFAVVLMIRVLTYVPPPTAGHTDTVWTGLNFVWEPNFTRLGDFGVWLAAAGQIFFTLSIGTGSIQVYASYLKKNEDCALTGLSTAMTNEFAEVVLGGTIAIPIAVATFGLANAQFIASQGSFDLGFVAMPLIFEQMPFGRLFATLWFSLLFFAGITSSVALMSPFVTFLQDEWNLSRRWASLVGGAMLFVFGLPIILFDKFDYLGQYDFWAGTFGLAVFSLIEVLIFAWAFGRTAMWEELTRGNSIRIPRVFYYIIRYVAPVYLTVLLAGWFYQDFGSAILLNGTSDEAKPYLWISRGTMIFLIATIAVMVGVAAARKQRAMKVESAEGAPA